MKLIDLEAKIPKRTDSADHFIPPYKVPGREIDAEDGIKKTERICPINWKVMNNTPEMQNCTIGSNCEISPNVMLGYKYQGWSNPLQIGNFCRLHSGTVIYADTRIGNYFTCGHNVTIRGECEIGDRVVILHGSTLEGKIKIGKGVKIMANVYIPSQTVIGGMVFIGPGVTILNARLPMRQPVISGVTIGDNVVIGGGVTIGSGVTIGNNVFVGAGATIIQDLPENTLAYGTPAKHKPLPQKFGNRNDPTQIFTGLDLWNPIEDDGSWKDEDFPGKEEWHDELNKSK